MVCNAPGCAALLVGKRRDARFCSAVCRKRAHRLSKELQRRERAAIPVRWVYADPPYQGHAHLYPEGREVNLRLLLAHLVTFDTWALSELPATLQTILRLLGDHGVVPRLGFWRSHSCPKMNRTRGPRRTMEVLVYQPCREVLRDDHPDDFLDHKARPRPTDLVQLPGVKPYAFCNWLFGTMQALPGDELVDLFPGSGGVTRAWGVYSSMPATRDT